MAINFPEGQQDYPGFIHRVVQDIKTDTFATSSTSFVTIPGLSATISPRSTASKILVMVELNGWAQNSQHGSFQLMRGTTALYLGDASGNRIRTSFGGFYANVSPQNECMNSVCIYLDSPSTTSSTTYSVRCATRTDYVVINRTRADPNNNDMLRTSSSITLLEVDS